MHIHIHTLPHLLSRPAQRRADGGLAPHSSCGDASLPASLLPAPRPSTCTACHAVVTSPWVMHIFRVCVELVAVAGKLRLLLRRLVGVVHARKAIVCIVVKVKQVFLQWQMQSKLTQAKI
eukprot:1159280-Pelagomonas_calceolata.AAC.1